ncbi:glutamate--cysteine ligase [Kickxella alabastrina]|nr:glutamate--cysteine ligase [Kickxella alabastrina]
MYSWQDILPRMEEIRRQATDQFIAAWRGSQTKKVNDFTWHETVGYVIVKRDDDSRRVVLSPRVPEILRELGCDLTLASTGMHPQVHDREASSNPGDTSANVAAEQTSWRPAHARFALRCEPQYLREFCVGQLATGISECLRERRRLLKSKLKPDEMLLSVGQFPLLGADIYIEDQDLTNGPLLRSMLLSENCLNPMPPFTLEIGGIIDRRGIVPYTAVPVFRDANTPWPFADKDLSLETLDFGILQSAVGLDGHARTAGTPAVPQHAVASVGNVAARPEAAVETPSYSADASAFNGVPSRDTQRMPYAVNPSPLPLMFEMPSGKNSLLLDSPLYGIGSGGVLRVTLCAADLGEARILYDQLAPICAIMTALTAATPIVKGHLTNRDCYWDVQCSAVDDRSAQERGIVPLTTAKGTLLKSRFGSIDTYLGPSPTSKNLAFHPEINDCQYTYDSCSYWKMKDGGVDNLLSQHVARLFIRDLHYASAKMLGDNNSGSGNRADGNDRSGNGNDNRNGSSASASIDSDGQEHFKRFLGCNRQNVCLYPPNTSTGSGWEIEFMSLEVQLTDAENAALITFIVLLSRVIISYRLNLYLPISQMDQNMSRAQKINAVKDQQFIFRRDVFSGKDGNSSSSGRIPWRGNVRSRPDPHMPGSPVEQDQFHRHIGIKSPESAEYVELTVDEILNGSPKHRVMGLLKIIQSFLPTLHLEYDVEREVRRQLWLVERRASGKLCTLATWMRRFVRNHPEYKRDSVVPPSINYDMLRTMNDIEEGKIMAPELLG